MDNQTPQSPFNSPAPSSPPTPTQDVFLQQPVPPPEQKPSNTLAVVGLILAFVANVIGLIVSIIAFVVSKKKGYTNKIAIVGIVVGVLMTILGIVAASAVLDEVVDRLADVRGTGNPLSTAPLNIDGTQVVLVGQTVTSACYMFTAPVDYILSPNASDCQTEIRLDNGTSTGVAASGIIVQAQSGDSTVADFVALIQQNGGTDVETLAVAGEPAARATIEDGNGLPRQVYFVSDTSARFLSGDETVTSYLISGPATGSGPETVVDSFRIF